MGPDPEKVDKEIDAMKNTQLQLAVEGDVSDFLGVKIDHKRDGNIYLTQSILINSILKKQQLNKLST
jgi:hypothetical protein